MRPASTLFLVASLFASVMPSDLDACRRRHARCCCPCLVPDGQSEFVVFDGGSDGKKFVFVASYDSEIDALHRVWQLHAEGLQGMYIEYFYDRAADRLITRKIIGPQTVDRYGRIATISPRRSEQPPQPKTSQPRERPRTWQNIDGSRSAIATLIRVEDDIAHFIREDGRNARCRLSQLSLPDREYIHANSAYAAGRIASHARR